MRILHILTQKPHSTGSGTYMAELINAMNDKGIENAAVYGLDDNEDKFFDETIAKNFDVRFNTSKLPFDVFGMSDEMPYKSSQFKNMTEDMFDMYKNAFSEKIKEAVDTFKPDLILCNHLYILAAITREIIKDIKIFGICHNTDLRQYVKTDLKRDYIKESINKIDFIFAPTKHIKNEIINIFNYDENKIKILGTGFNDKIFYNHNLEKDKIKTKFVYAGKISRAKGVLDLVKAFKLAETDPNFDIDNVELNIAGKSGNEEEYNSIVDVVNSLKIKKTIHGMLDKKALSNLYITQNVFIITSYSEGLPLSTIEALSCGLKVIITNIKGVTDFLDTHVENAYIDYVTLPKIINYDETTEDEAKKFQARIKDAIIKATKDKKEYTPIIKDVSWEQLTEIIVKTYGELL